MEFFKKLTNIDFMGLRRWTAMISLLLFGFSIWSLCQHGLNLGLDFTGGTQIELHMAQEAKLNEIRSSLEAAGIDRVVVQSYGTTHDVLLSLAPRTDNDQKALTTSLVKILPLAKIMRVEFVGPQVGKELTSRGITAVVASLIATMIYILFRFELRFAISSTLALIHDPILILGVFSYFQLEFDLVALGALLAIIGYSLNDTIVVFDRVRENFRKIRKGTSLDIMNLSINQTLSRTLMTSGLTLLVVVALLLYGGEQIHGFSIALLVGILVGTYSSIYVAGALAVAMGLDRKDFLPREKQAVDESP